MLKSYFLILFGFLPNWAIVTLFVFIGLILLVVIFKIVALVMDILPFV